MVKHNLDNHFQAVNAKTRRGSPSYDMTNENQINLILVFDLYRDWGLTKPCMNIEQPHK